MRGTLCALAWLSACQADPPADSDGAIPTDDAPTDTDGDTGVVCVPATETCDGLDEDCDGVPDDGPCSAPAVAGTWFLGGTAVDHVRGVAADDAGNTYISGGVSAPAQLDGPVTETHGYIASLDPSGAMRWSRTWGSTGGNYGQDVSVGSGIACVGGAFDGTADFGGGAVVSSGNNDAFVLCVDAATGDHRWDRQFGDDNSDIVQGVRVGPSGEVVLSGSIGAGGTDFGGGLVADAAGWFVARYGADGSFGWVHSFRDARPSFGTTAAIDADGNITAVGHMFGTVDFGGGPRTPPGGSGGVLLSLGPDGSHRWDHVADGAVDYYNADAQADGTVVVAGDFSGPLDLGGAVVSSHTYGQRDVFAAAFGADGAFRWQFTAGGDGSTRGFGLDVGPDDGVYLAAGFTGTTRFGDTSRTSAGEHDLFAIGLTPDGAYLWDVVLGGAADEQLHEIAALPSGGVVTGGEGWGDVTIAGDAHTNAGSVDGVLVWLE